MLIIAINGSPRKNGSTAKLLHKALEGAASQGAEVEFVQLNKLKMKACQACFSCKKRGGKNYAKCVIEDDLTPLQKRIEQADGLFLGSPIYFHSITPDMLIFISRLYHYFNYGELKTLFPKNLKVGLIYTMGADDETMKLWYRKYTKMNQFMISTLLGTAETLISTDTFHVDDYSKIVADAMEPVIDRKSKHKEQVFPLDCQKAFEMGVRFASPGANAQ